MAPAPYEILIKVTKGITMKKYLITGGGFANKGAESMLYTLISELRAHGDCDITVHVVHGFEFANHCIPGIKFIPFSFKERNKY